MVDQPLVNNGDEENWLLMGKSLARQTTIGIARIKSYFVIQLNQYLDRQREVVDVNIIRESFLGCCSCWLRFCFNRELRICKNLSLIQEVFGSESQYFRKLYFASQTPNFFFLKYQLTKRIFRCKWVNVYLDKRGKEKGVKVLLHVQRGMGVWPW